MKFYQMLVAGLAAMLFATSPVFADAKTAGKTYDEPTFIKMLGKKSRAEVLSMLGQPVRKQLSVKPTNAESVIGRPLNNSGSTAPVNVEMWYYNNIVRYDAKNTYKTTELTFVNGRCTDVAFFNNF